ncbi:MAG TPA: SDR family oxidoreductase [Stellaceae bacterium]|nr:SDR family oxidoreductase [Stellaceae bacterium]
MDLGLKGKKAIITGSTRGIGRRIAELLAREGCSVGIGARKADEVETALGELRATGASVKGAVLDVKDAVAYKGWIEGLAGELGGLDIFVHNVSGGGGMDGETSWYNCFELDLMGAVRGVETVQPHLETAGGGAIVFIGTTAAIETFIAPMGYNALKAGLITYAKQLSQALMPKGIRVNVVSPGPIYFPGGAWEGIKNSMPEFYESHRVLQPSGRMGTAEEVANCVGFLASPAASWVTGVNLVVDGGYTKRVQF